MFTLYFGFEQLRPLQKIIFQYRKELINYMSKFEAVCLCVGLKICEYQPIVMSAFLENDNYQITNCFAIQLIVFMSLLFPNMQHTF